MRNESFASALAKHMDLHCEPTSKQALIEIFDDRWLLIEKHCGVIGYTRDKITVKLSKGCLCIQGADLKLGKMSKDQLKIYGIIHSVKFCGRERL